MNMHRVNPRAQTRDRKQIHKLLLAQLQGAPLHWTLCSNTGGSLYGDPLWVPSPIAVQLGLCR